MDNWIKLNIGHRLASSILAMRPAVEALIVRMCEEPDKIAEPTEEDKALITVIQVSVKALGCWFPFLKSYRGSRTVAPLRNYSSITQ